MRLILILILLNSCTTYQDRVEGRSALSSVGEFSANEYIYAKGKGWQNAGDLFLPEHAGPHPIVILIHGGGWARGKREQMTSAAERFVRQGIAVFNISYRFAPQYTWPAQYQDVEAAHHWVIKNAEKFNLDIKRIGAFGYSAGAHLSLLLAYHPNRDKDENLVAVAGGGSPVDLTAWPKGELVVDFIGYPFATHSQLYRDASPLEYVRQGLPPTYLYHGKHDWIVEVDQSKRLHAALKKTGVESYYDEPFFGHVASFLFDSSEVDDVISFFKGKFSPGE